MTNHRTRRAAMAGLLSTGLLLGACAAGPSRSGGSSDPAATSSAAPTATPTVTIIPPNPATGQPPGSAPPPAGPSYAEPPAATLAVDGGDPVTGELGSFTWDNSGSDAPWLAGSPLHVGRGEALTLRFATDVEVATWTVDRAPAGTDGSDMTGMAERSGQPVTFAAPPHGSWTVNVNVWFAGNLGSGSWYWLVTVD